MKKTLAFLLLFALLLSLSACADPVIGAPQGAEPVPGDDAEAAGAVIELRGDSVSYPGKGVAVQGSTVTIGAPGEYTVRGTLADGRIIIDLREIPGKVSLILDGADITCLTDSAIYVAQAKEVNLVLAAGSENRVVSGAEADLPAWKDTNSGAAIFAEDDLDIQGEGSLAVYGYLNSGVVCKDDLKLKGGTITVLAANNGLRGSESVTVSGGVISVEAGNDGLKASSAKKAGKGFVLIEGGELSVTAGGDGVSAETELTVAGGSVTVTTTGDPAAKSCKGLKGKTGVTLSGGTVTVVSQDHAVRSQAGMTVSGGELTLKSVQGKGLAAEEELLVSGGTLFVTAADDGLVSASAVTVRGGELEIRAGADGIQGGKKGTGFAASVGTVSIEDGRVLVSAYNKSVDAKAGFTLTGGTVFLCGGGSLSADCRVPHLLASVSGKGGETLRVDGGEELQAVYDYSSVLYAAPGLESGKSYTLQTGSQKQTLEAQG